MTEIMPVPRKLNFTVLPAGSLCLPLFLSYTKEQVKTAKDELPMHS